MTEPARQASIPGTVSRRAPEPSLWGRDEELAVASTFLEALRDGPATLGVEGEPGMGKSTFLGAISRRARAHEYRILSCGPIEPESRLAFAGLSDLLALALDEALPRLPAPQRRALEGALLLAGGERSPSDPRTVAAAAHGVLSQLALAKPVLLVVDDLQWLDPSSTRTLMLALRRIGELPVGLLTAFRPDALSDQHRRLVRAIAIGHRSTMALAPLDAEATAGLLRSHFGKRFPRANVTYLQRASGGNPLFALELARGIEEDGSWPSSDRPLPVPSTLRELVAVRIGKLTPGARRAALIVSATAHSTPDLLRAALGETAERDLRDAVDAHVLVPQGERLGFAHSLIGSVLTSDASREERRALHARLADLVADPEERPRHLALAAEEPDTSVADALEGAADAAFRRGAPEVAAELSDLACRMTPDEHPQERLRRTIDLAEFSFEAGDTQGARQMLEWAIPKLPRGPRRAEALRRLSRVRLQSDNCWAARELLYQALGDVGEDRRMAATIQRDLAIACAFMGDLRNLGPHADQAVALAEEVGDDRVLGHALGLCAFGRLVAGRGLRMDLLERALELEDRTERLPVALYPFVLYAMVHESLLRWDVARDQLTDGIAELAERGDENSLAYLLCHLARIEFWSGRWSEALRHAEDSCRSAVLTGQQPVLAYALRMRATVEIHLGFVERARASALECVEVGQRTGSLRAWMEGLAVMGFIELSLGNPHGADRYLRQIAQSDDLWLPYAASYEVEALTALGEIELARHLSRRVAGAAIRQPNRFGAILSARTAGLVSAAAGDYETALVYFESAIVAHDASSASFELARTLLAKGLIHRQAGQQAAALRCLKEAASVFEGLGAPLWLERARTEIART